MSTSTQWHMNVYSAVTMLNNCSLTIALKQFCESNGLSTIFSKFVKTDGTIKPQYVTVDNGFVTRKIAMSLHVWHSGDNDILANNRLTFRVPTGQDVRVNSHVTILNSPDRNARGDRQ
eukprot:6487656-Amphidinium_carterae.1